MKIKPSLPSFPNLTLPPFSTSLIPLAFIPSSFLSTRHSSVKHQKMASRRGLLSLPRELRDMIYQPYLELDDGYAYNGVSGKLRSTSGKPISLDLMYTCRLINEEMKGLALRSNKITFATFFSEDLDSRARQLHGTMKAAFLLKAFLLLFTLRFGPACVVADIMEKIACKYPQFAKLLEEICAGRYSDTYPFPFPFGHPSNHFDLDVAQIDNLFWITALGPPINSSGLVPSMYRDAMDAAFALAAERFPYTEYESRYDSTRDPLPDFELLVSTTCEPWAYPTEERIRQVSRLTGTERSRDRALTHMTDKRRYRLSAAAAAIEFLHSISKENLLYIRRIVLFEDRLAFPHQECHAQGLIPMCQENQLLRIERRVDLW